MTGGSSVRAVEEEEAERGLGWTRIPVLTHSPTRFPAPSFIAARPCHAKFMAPLSCTSNVLRYISQTLSVSAFGQQQLNMEAQTKPDCKHEHRKIVPV